MMETFTTDDGCRIAWRFDGAQDAPVLLLSNSLGTTSAMWAPQMAAFTAGFRVLRYDGRGHGASSSPHGDYTLERLGRDAVQLLDSLGLEQVAFCGLSLGGMVGQWLGLNAPERIGRLILANTSSYMGPPSGWESRIATVRAQGMRPIAEASVSRWFTPAFVASGAPAIGAIVDDLLATDPAGYAGCCAAIRDMDLRPSVSGIALPALVIGGAHDPATPVAHSEALQAAIAGAHLALLPAAHLSSIECPEAFNEAALDFLLA